jgi:hypothetical protein
LRVGDYYGNILIKHLTYKTTLNIYFRLSFLVMLFVVSCSTDTPTKLVDTVVKLNTSNKQLQSNFDSCLRLTQQLIKTQISDTEFHKYFNFDTNATGLEYDNVVLSVEDTLSKMPKTYQIFYDFIFKGDTISSFRADYDSTLKSIDYRKFYLTAFRQFIDKKLTIINSIAADIAVRNGMKREGLQLILNCSADKFYWECKNDCNGCLYLDIDAKTGNIIGQGKVIYQY